MAMTDFAGKRGDNTSGKHKLLFLDVRRASFYAPAQRLVFVHPPHEAGRPHGMCARLNVSMYGTNDAASHWEAKFSSHLRSQGFVQGKSSPCIFYQPARGTRLVVHGDDFTFLAHERDLLWCKDMMRSEYEIKDRGTLGPDPQDDKHTRILKRCLEWRGDGLYYEAGPRHAEIIISDLGLENANSVATPVKTVPQPWDDQPLWFDEARRFRQVVARCNFLSKDRCDLQYAVNECARGMSQPTTGNLERLKRIGRFLIGRPRYIIRFARQKHVFALNCFSDSDWAGDLATRTSTSGGVIALGDHCLKSWSTNQSVVALSSGEAEHYATNKTAANGLGMKSLMHDLGIDLQIKTSY